MINGQRTRAIVDSGASGNFIAAYYVRKYDVPTRRHLTLYQLHLVDGKPIDKNQGWIREITRPLPFLIGKHHEELSLDIVAIPRYDIILGLPWLRKHNPSIDWKTHQVSLEGCTCQVALDLQDPVEIDTIDIKELKEIQSMNPTPTVCVTEGPGLPQEYNEFEKLFSEEEAELELPKHQP